MDRYQGLMGDCGGLTGHGGGGSVRKHLKGDRGGRGVMKTRRVLRRRTTMHWDVTGIVVKHVWADRSVVGGQLGGARTEARWIVGDAVRLPALLFDVVTSDSGQVGEAL